jgi:cell division inhibitor SepF
MAGAMRKAMVYLGLVEDEDRYDYDDYDEMTGTDGDAHRAASGSRSLAPLREDTRGSVATMTERRPQVGVASSVRSFDRITTIHPRTYNEAKQIGESFRESTPVIMNLSDMDDSDAKRLVDFAAGLVFGLRGTIERVTNKVFLLSPANVTVTAEDKARMAESGFFNQS